MTKGRMPINYEGFIENLRRRGEWVDLTDSVCTVRVDNVTTDEMYLYSWIIRVMREMYEVNIMCWPFGTEEESYFLVRWDTKNSEVDFKMKRSLEALRDAFPKAKTTVKMGECYNVY